MIERRKYLLQLANKMEPLRELRDSRGLFIAVEGIDGAGKTSVANEIVNFFKNRCFESTIFRSFIEAPFWQSVMLSKRQIAESRKSWATDFDRGVQVAVFLAHVRNELNCFLSAYDVVVADRYTLSKAAFCRYLYKGKVNFAEEMLYAATDTPQPDILIYLRVSAEEACRRIEERYKKKGIEKDWRENLKTLKRVVRYYDLVIGEKNFSSSKVVINAERPLLVVTQDIIEILKHRILMK